MKIEYLSNEEYLKETRQYSKLQPLLDEFMKTDQPIMKIDPTGTYKQVRNCYNSWYSAARRSNYPLTVRTRGGFVYILKKNEKD